MAFKPDYPPRRPCHCGGANPNCLQCGGKGFIEPPGVRSIMAGPAGIRRRLPIIRESAGTIQGPPEPVRCPHCGLDVLLLAVHLAEAHPEQPQCETAAEREAREREEARLAAVAAEIARREAEAAQRKAEARARRQAVEGPQAATPWPGHLRGTPPRKPPGEPSEHARPVATAAPADPPAPAETPDVGPPGQDRPQPPSTETERPLASPADTTWERMRRALAERTVLTGVIRSRRPFGVFIDLGGIEGLVRMRELPAEEPGLQDGQTVKVVVIGMSEDTHHVELSMRRAGDPRPSLTARGATRPEARPAEGPMALAFRLAQAKKKQTK